MSNIKKSQGGFTLIELLIVVLIIGILAAIAIPIFSGQRTKAKNSSALSTLQHAKQAATSFSIGNNENYACITPDKLLAEEESLEFNDANPPSPGGDANPKAVYIFASSGVPKTRITNANCNPTPTNPENSITRSGIILCTVSKGNKSYCARQLTIGNSISPWMDTEIGEEYLLEDRINNDSIWSPDETSNPGSGGSGTSQSNCEAAGGTWNTFEGMPGGYCLGQICPAGQAWNSMTDPQSCVEPPTCPEGQILMPGTVNCYTPMEPCPAGEYRDISGDCVPLGGGGPGLPGPGPGGSEYTKTNAFIELFYICDGSIIKEDFDNNQTGLCGGAGSPQASGLHSSMGSDGEWDYLSPSQYISFSNSSGFESFANTAWRYQDQNNTKSFEELYDNCDLNNTNFNQVNNHPSNPANQTDFPFIIGRTFYYNNCYNSTDGLIISGNNINDISFDNNVEPWSVLSTKQIIADKNDCNPEDSNNCELKVMGKLLVAIEYKCDMNETNHSLRVDYEGMVFNFNQSNHIGNNICVDDTQMGWN